MSQKPIQINFQVAALLLPIGFASFISLADTTTPDPREADHNELRKLKVLVEEAINTNQLDLIRPHLDDPFSIVTYTDREFSDFDAFQDRWQKTRQELLSGGSYATKLLPERSQLYGDVAICRGNSHNVLVTGSGDRFEFDSHWSAVCRMVDGRWKIVRAHSSLSPFDNPMIVAKVKGMLTKVGIGTLIVGLLIGWIVKTFVAKRQGSP